MNPRLAVYSPYYKECDTVIWNAFKESNQEAFAVLYYKYFKLLLNRGLIISNDRELVKDCIHDLFLDIWKTKTNLATPVSVKAYLIVSLQRKLFRQIKKTRTQQTEINKLSYESVCSKEDQIISEQTILDNQFIIAKAVNSLTKRQKEAIKLKFYDNLTYEEIAGMMKISTDSIYNLISKAIGSLNQELAKVSQPCLYKLI